jgi:hypothetical protein
MNRHEHRLSHWAGELIERIMLEPYWATAVDTGTMMVSPDPHARMIWESRRRFMGIKPHHLDWYVYQNPTFVQIELKHGYNQPSEGQRTTMRLLNERGIQTDVCWSIPQFYGALLNAGFRLHANAQNIMFEIDERYKAAERAAEEPKAKAKPRKPSAPRATKSQTDAVARIRAAGIRI